MSKEIKLFVKEKLDKTGHTKYWLQKQTGVSPPAITRYYENNIKKYDSYIILKICLALHCEPGDIIKIVCSK